MGWRTRKHMVPTVTPSFRLKAWRTFQITLDPLSRPKVSPEAHSPCDEAPLTVDAITALMNG